MMTYSDDILRQFLDGALDQAKTKEIETAMLSDADLEARIMGLDDLAASVKSVMEALPPAHASVHCSEEHQPHRSPETTWLMGPHAEGLSCIMWRHVDELLKVAFETIDNAPPGMEPLQLIAAVMDALLALDCPGARAAMEPYPSTVLPP